MPSTLRIAVYLSAHGYGHLMRTGEFLRCLAAQRELSLDVTAPHPAALWPRDLVARSSWRRVPCDAGARQSDDLHVDVAATAAAAEGWLEQEAGFIEEEAARIRGAVDLVLADVPPAAFSIAELAGVPSVGLANFSWDWIYAEMGIPGPARSAAGHYAKADLLISLTPGAPMEAFPRSLDAGLLGRRSTALRHVIRESLSIRLQERMILVSFRAVGACGMFALPEPSFGVRYVLPPGAELPPGRTDVQAAGPDAEYIDLVAAADLVVSKPGYGILGDTAACGTPLLWAARHGFPEDRVLSLWLESRTWASPVSGEALASGHWLEAADGLLAMGRPEPAELPALALGAEAVLGLVG